MRDVTVGGVLVLAAATGFATLATIGKLAEAAGLTRQTLLVFRFFIGSIFVWIVLAVRGETVLLWGRPGRAAIALGVVYAALSLAYFWGLSFMTASLTGIVFYTYPIYVFGLSVLFLEERLTRTLVGALALALAGVVLVVGVDSLLVSVPGLLLVTAAAICYAIYNVAGRALVADISPRLLTAHVLVVTTAVVALRWVQTDGGLPTTPRQLWLVIAIGVIGTGIPLVFLYEGLGRIEATHASILGTAEPVMTVLFGVIILGETLAMRTMVGGVLILAGVTLVQTNRDQRAWLLSKIGIH